MTGEATESWRGKIGKLSPRELAEFLEEPHLVRLACLDAEGWPYVVPVWYQWNGDGLWVVPREKSAWARMLDSDPRCAVTIDDASSAQESSTSRVQRRFVAQCRASIVERPNVGGKWVEIARTMAIRYYGDNGPKYLEPTLRWKRWLISLEPVKTWTWQGIAWAKRYLDEDSAGQ